MYRMIEKELKSWKESSGKKPVLIQGSRGTGKTYTVIKFARENYRKTVYLDFEENPTLGGTFQGKYFS